MAIFLIEQAGRRRLSRVSARSGREKGVAIVVRAAARRF
jgi:hypothetical protein